MSPDETRKKMKAPRRKISPAWMVAIVVFAVSVAIGLFGPRDAWFGVSVIGVIGSLLFMAYLWVEAPDRPWGGRKTAAGRKTARPLGPAVPDQPPGNAPPETIREDRQTVTENAPGLAVQIAADAAHDSAYRQSPLETREGVGTEETPWEDVLSVNNGPERIVTLRRYSTGAYALAHEVFRWPRTPSDSGSFELIHLTELPRGFPHGWTIRQFARTACQSEEARAACAAAPAVIRFFRVEESGQEQ